MGKKNQIVLCDTNVLFGFFNGHVEISNPLKDIGEENIAFSIITHAETFAGASREEVRKFRLFFDKHLVYHIDESTSKIFNGLILSNHQRHSKWISDALIAATAISFQLPLYTLNRKDFDFIPELKLHNP